MGDPAKPRTHIGMTERDNRRCYFARDNGIGLALVKRIIEVHDGEIWIESDGSAQGTAVFYTLPVS